MRLRKSYQHNTCGHNTISAPESHDCLLTVHKSSSTKHPYVTLATDTFLSQSQAAPYDVEFARYPNGGDSFYGVPGIRNGRLPGVDDKECVKTMADCPDPAKSKASGWKSCYLCPEMRNPEDRGPLLPPLGKAFMDGSIKPGHQELIRVSNNYHKFGVTSATDRDAPRTHVGYRDVTKDPTLDEEMGYWIWSTSGLTEAEMNRCRVSNNPPVLEFQGLQGHGLDAAYGFGTANDGTGGLLYLDGSSTGGAPGTGATAHAVLSGNTTTCATTLGCYVTSIVIDTPGAGYNKPPVVVFSGGGSGHGAKATAYLSGGTVFKIEIDGNNKGMSYTSVPNVTLVAVDQATVYDQGVGHGTYQVRIARFPNPNTPFADCPPVITRGLTRLTLFV